MAIIERTVPVGEVDLAVREAGTGGRPLLLVHGFTGASTDFVDFLEPLAEAGWQAVELSTEHLEVLRDAPDSQARLVSLRHLASSLDLAMPQAHLTITANVAHIDPERRQHDQETIRRDLQVLAALGIPTGVLHTGGNRDLQTAEQRASSANQQVQSSAFAVPKNDEEYVRRVSEAKTPEERIAIKESYQKK